MKRVRHILIGTPDRVLATISLLLSLVSLGFSIYAYRTPVPRPDYLIARDATIVAMLVATIMTLSIKYYKKDDLVERFRNTLAEQVKSSHHMTHNFRDHFFWEIRNELAAEEDLTEKRINEIKQEYFDNVCRTILMDTRNLLLEYFGARGFRLGDDLSVTIKIKVKPEEAQEILNKIKGEKADILNKSESYMVTAYRDPNTWGKKPERTEIMQILYHINESNTTFDEIINKGKSYYLSNNLIQEYNQGRYRNQNPNWQNSYNSVLAVPIRYRRQGDPRATIVYGTISVDSLNARNYELFEDKITFHLLAESADILAIMFGHFDILQILSQYTKG